MAGATLAEQQGLQRAIAAAIEKEDRARGLIVGNERQVTTYVAIYNIRGKIAKIECTDLEAFTNAVKDVHSQFPNLKVTILERVEKRPLPTFKI